VLNLKGRDAARSYAAPALCADIDGFRLHAAVRCGIADSQALEKLCRYITRFALVTERVQTVATVQVVLKLKTPGATRSHTWSRCRWSSCSGGQRSCHGYDCTHQRLLQGCQPRQSGTRSGSACAGRARDLTAGKLTAKLSYRKADICGRQWMTLRRQSATPIACPEADSPACQLDPPWRSGQSRDSSLSEIA